MRGCWAPLWPDRCTSIVQQRPTFSFDTSSARTSIPLFTKAAIFPKSFIISIDQSWQIVDPIIRAENPRACRAREAWQATKYISALIDRSIKIRCSNRSEFSATISPLCVCFLVSSWLIIFYFSLFFFHVSQWRQGKSASCVFGTYPFARDSRRSSPRATIAQFGSSHWRNVVESCRITHRAHRAHVARLSCSNKVIFFSLFLSIPRTFHIPFFPNEFFFQPYCDIFFSKRSFSRVCSTLSLSLFPPPSRGSTPRNMERDIINIQRRENYREDGATNTRWRGDPTHEAE